MSRPRDDQGEERTAVTTRVGINGFGRIGRNFWRAVHAGAGERRGDIEIVAANDLGDVATMAHLLKYDTALGNLPLDVSVSGDQIRAGDSSFRILAEPDPARFPWADLVLDIVIESPGRLPCAASYSSSRATVATSPRS